MDVLVVNKNIKYDLIWGWFSDGVMELIVENISEDIEGRDGDRLHPGIGIHIPSEVHDWIKGLRSVVFVGCIRQIEFRIVKLSIYYVFILYFLQFQKGTSRNSIILLIEV